MTEVDLWDVLRNLVAFDTVPTSSNVPAAEYLANLLDGTPWSVRLFRDRALGADKASLVAWTGPPRADGLILSGHMDVVPFTDQPGWTRDPLRLSTDGKRVYGRGVSDMKAFLAQCIVVARSLDHRRLQRPLVLVLTCDEEVGCLGAARLLPHLDRLTGELPLPTEAVIGEPTSFRVYRAHKGHVRLDIHLAGRGGHSSRPDLGTNAIAAAVEAASELGRLTDELARRTGDRSRALFPDFPGIPLNLGVIRGGTADNMIAEECTLSVGIRPLPDTDVGQLIAEVEDRTRAAVRTRYPGATLSLAAVEVTPAMESPPTGRLATVLGLLAGQDQFAGAPFATDGGQLQRHGIHSYIWGPGELEQAHQPDESLPIEVLERGVDLIRRLISEICCEGLDR